MERQRPPAPHGLTLGDSPAEIDRDIQVVSQIEAIPTLLEVICDITGMRFAAIARVTDHTWVACAVKDKIDFGLKAGDHLDVTTTLCIESKRMVEPIMIEHASLDPRYGHHPTPKMYRIESYLSVPIVLPDGRYFGNLCALDPAPKPLSDPKIMGVFKRFATLVALQLNTEIARERDQSALLDERATSELREQFIAILGHDLRNPLQAIFATTELIIRKTTEPAIAGLAARIKANSKRMTSLIDDVLDFARGRLGGGLGVQMQDDEQVDVGLEAIVKELQEGHPSRRIVSSINVPRAVRCDLRRIQQVASNLIGNAVAHGAPDTPIHVTARADGADFVFEVWNEGDPIPEENIGKVFDPFWRRSTDAHREGLGLGLHIASQIVRAHGGQLLVTSSKESGTQFTARVPLQLPSRGLGDMGRSAATAL